MYVKLVQCSPRLIGGGGGGGESIKESCFEWHKRFEEGRENMEGGEKVVVQDLTERRKC